LQLHRVADWNTRTFWIVTYRHGLGSLCYMYWSELDPPITLIFISTVMTGFLWGKRSIQYSRARFAKVGFIATHYNQMVGLEDS
jgi:hypothetical protein